MIGASSTRADRAVLAGAAVLVTVSVAFRCYALGRLPGVNGDEAWYGVQVLRLLSGEPVDWRTPSGNLLGPIHSGLLLLLQPFAPRSLAALRLPALISSLAQLVLTWLVVRRHLGRSAALVALVLHRGAPHRHRLRALRLGRQPLGARGHRRAPLRPLGCGLGERRPPRAGAGGPADQRLPRAVPLLHLSLRRGGAAGLAWGGASLGAARPAPRGGARR